MQHIPNIGCIIWDFDGTLYQQKPALWDEIRASEIRVIMDVTGWDEKKAKEEFYKIYKVLTPSGTKTVSILTHLTGKQAAIQCTRYVDYAKYLEKDPALSELFAKLSGYVHYMLVNGTVQSVTKGLGLLGLDHHLFSAIVTSEMVGESKPSERGFRYILDQTGLPAGAHLMVGDREAVDLVPAKALGIRTCLVWSTTESAIADVTVPAVYDVASVVG